MSTDQLTGLQLAIALLAQIGDDDSDRAIAAVHDLADEHTQRLTLQHHACDLAQRVADLERLNGMHKAAWLAYQPLGDYMQALSMARKLPVGTLGHHLVERMQAQEARIADLERNISSLVSESEAKIPAMQAAFEERLTLDRANRLLVARIADLETKCCTLKYLHDAAADERDELRARLAEIEAQEPVALVETSGDQGAGIGWSGAAQPVGAKLYARPVPAQAVPDADGARFRWLCEDHSDRETRERCRSLIDRLPVMSYSDALMSIDAAMAAAPEHKA